MNKVDKIIKELSLKQTKSIYKNLPNLNPKEQLKVLRRISTAYKNFINEYKEELDEKSINDLVQTYINKINKIKQYVETYLTTKNIHGGKKTKKPKVTLQELRLKAKQLNIIGRSKMNKAELELALKKKPKSKSRQIKQ